MFNSAFKEQYVITEQFHYKVGLTQVTVIIPQLSAWRAHPSSQPLASVYVKFFGHEIAFANVDKAIVDQVIEVLNVVQLHSLFFNQ